MDGVFGSCTSNGNLLFIYESFQIIHDLVLDGTTFLQNCNSGLSFVGFLFLVLQLPSNTLQYTLGGSVWDDLHCLQFLEWPLCGRRLAEKVLMEGQNGTSYCRVGMCICFLEQLISGDWFVLH